MMLADRYVNPYTDFGFKMLFGTEMHKDLLISFVNSLFAGKEVIKDLSYLNTEYLGNSELDRRAVFDVYCENEQGQKGEWNYQLKAVYVIGILDFTFDDKDDNYFHHEVKLMDVATKEVFGEC